MTNEVKLLIDSCHYKSAMAICWLKNNYRSRSDVAILRRIKKIYRNGEDHKERICDMNIYFYDDRICFKGYTVSYPALIAGLIECTNGGGIDG